MLTATLFNPLMFLLIIMLILTGVVIGTIYTATTRMPVTTVMALCLPFTLLTNLIISLCFLAALYAGGIGGRLIAQFLTARGKDDGEPVEPHVNMARIYRKKMLYFSGGAFIALAAALVLLAMFNPVLIRLRLILTDAEQLGFSLLSIAIVTVCIAEAYHKSLIAAFLGLVLAYLLTGTSGNLNEFRLPGGTYHLQYGLFPLVTGIYTVYKIATRTTPVKEPEPADTANTKPDMFSGVCQSGALFPLFAFGLPVSSTMFVLLLAANLQGFNPSAVTTYNFAALFIIFGSYLTALLLSVLLRHSGIVISARLKGCSNWLVIVPILLMSGGGAYMWMQKPVPADIIAFIIICAIVYLFDRFRIPFVPFIFAFITGAELFMYLMRSRMLYPSFGAMVQRPLFSISLLLTVLVLAGRWYYDAKCRNRISKSSATQSAPQ